MFKKINNRGSGILWVFFIAIIVVIFIFNSRIQKELLTNQPQGVIPVQSPAAKQKDKPRQESAVTVRPSQGRKYSEEKELTFDGAESKKEDKKKIIYEKPLNDVILVQ